MRSLMSNVLVAEIPSLPHIVAALNFLAAVLLIAGFVLIKQKHESAHKKVMISCFVVSILFLVCYVTKIVVNGDTKFPRNEFPTAALFYYPLLISHVLLATTVPVLASVTIVLGLRDRREKHRRWARITFPVWLYVSVTGVMVYLLLNWICVSQ